MANWSSLKASIKFLQAMLETETDALRASRIEAEIAAKKAILRTRSKR